MFSKTIKYLLKSSLLIYMIRCVIGLTIGYKIYVNLPKYEPLWILISIMLVISPEEKDSRRISVDRSKANLIGSLIGLLCVLMHEPVYFSILIGVLLTIITCYLFKMMNMSRIALVSLVIILMHPHHGIHAELDPLYRFGAVTVGCLIGLIIVVITSVITRSLKKHYGIPLK